MKYRRTSLERPPFLPQEMWPPKISGLWHRFNCIAMSLFAPKYCGLSFLGRWFLVAIVFPREVSLYSDCEWMFKISTLTRILTTNTVYWRKYTGMCSNFINAHHAVAPHNAWNHILTDSTEHNLLGNNQVWDSAKHWNTYTFWQGGGGYFKVPSTLLQRYKNKWVLKMKNNI